MTLTSHAIVGAAIANLAPDHPGLGFALAWASHYALDMVPHLDYDVDSLTNDIRPVHRILWNRRAMGKISLIAADFAFGMLVCMVIFAYDRTTFVATLAGVAGGMLPDFLQFCYHAWKKFPWTFFQKFHDFFHHPDKMKDKRVRGVASQILLPLAVLVGYFLVK
ncbi:MAG: hypothetical protein KGH93_01490 [Patescibacteria group bacterium]|nr:hypothetical protein [Patescibacteria group bacterium]MDE1945854.1 hypothetical protein [Patescibacteria group bacterium]